MPSIRMLTPITCPAPLLQPEPETKSSKDPPPLLKLPDCGRPTPCVFSGCDTFQSGLVMLPLDPNLVLLAISKSAVGFFVPIPMLSSISIVTALRDGSGKTQALLP